MEKLASHVSETARENIERWLNEPKYAEYRDELVGMIENEQWQELEDAFFKVIEFGTGGRRGMVGLGSNRINRVTVGESAQALCEYILNIDSQAAQKGIAIACDTRLSSPELSRYCAQVCAAHDFKTYIFESFRSTPELSFAVRHLGCAAGIVITASHNPPSDNGFKAYWSDGCQLVAPHDKGVLEMAAHGDVIKSVDYQEALSDGRIEEIGESVDAAYIQAVCAVSEGSERNLRVVYSPLHGAGQRNTLPVLREMGFTVEPVEVQMTPDGNFPTIENGKPNPEDPSANRLAIEQMLASDADIAITNDPDADRLGITVNNHGTAVYLSGNQASVLATEYVLAARAARHGLQATDYVAKTIVTTDMMAAIAAKYGVRCVGNLLIGFKYIGEVIRNSENTGETFLIGGEESFGMLKGTYARDKDGASGSLMMAEYAAQLKAEGKNLYERLMELYKDYGLYIERLDSIMYPGADGFERMKSIMAELRERPPAQVGEHRVTAILDYATLKRRDITSGAITDIDCIKGDVIVLECNDDARCRLTIRPSGTEPKLKVYAQWYVPAAANDIEGQYQALTSELETTSKQLEKVLLGE